MLGLDLCRSMGRRIWKGKVRRTTTWRTTRAANIPTRNVSLAPIKLDGVGPVDNRPSTD